MINNKIIYSLVFLPLICYLGFITSYEDFLVSKIRNKWILIGLIYPLTIYSLAWILCDLASQGIVGPILGGISSYLVWNFDKWCINLVISSLVAYFLWYFKMWAAGDAKLFICYAALIPIGQYSRMYLNYYFASFLLLLSIFIPATIFLFLRSMVYFIKRFDLNKIKIQMPKLIKEKFTNFNKIELSKLLIGFFVFFLFFRILRQEFRNLIDKTLPNQNILMLVSLLVFKPLSKFFKKNTRFIVIAFVILIMYIGFKMIHSREQFNLEIGDVLRRTLLIMILFPIFKKILNLYADRTTQKTIPFAIWMFLGVLIVWFI